MAGPFYGLSPIRKISFQFERYLGACNVIDNYPWP